MSELPQKKHTTEEIEGMRGLNKHVRVQTPMPTQHEPMQPSHFVPASSIPEIPTHIDVPRHRHITPEKHGNINLYQGMRPAAADEQLTQQEYYQAPHATIPAAHSHAPVYSHVPVKSGVSHAFDGMLPQAAAGQSPASTHHTELPTAKHNHQELVKAKRKAVQLSRPVDSMLQMKLNPITTIILYLIAIGIIVASIMLFPDMPNNYVEVPEGKTFVEAYPNPIRAHHYFAPVGGGIFLIITGLFIYLKKNRSRHHAAFLGTIGILTIVFLFLYITNSPYAA